MFGLILKDFHFLQRNSAKSKNQNALVVCQKPLHARGDKKKILFAHIKLHSESEHQDQMEAFNYDKQTPFSFCSGVCERGEWSRKYFTSVSEVEKEHVNFDAGR